MAETTTTTASSTKVNPFVLFTFTSQARVRVSLPELSLQVIQRVQRSRQLFRCTKLWFSLLLPGGKRELLLLMTSLQISAECWLPKVGVEAFRLRSSRCTLNTSPLCFLREHSLEPKPLTFRRTRRCPLSAPLWRR